MARQENEQPLNGFIHDIWDDLYSAEYHMKPPSSMHLVRYQTRDPPVVVMDRVLEHITDMYCGITGLSLG